MVSYSHKPRPHRTMSQGRSRGTAGHRQLMPEATKLAMATEAMAVPKTLGQHLALQCSASSAHFKLSSHYSLAKMAVNGGRKISINCFAQTFRTPPYHPKPTAAHDSKPLEKTAEK